MPDWCKTAFPSRDRKGVVLAVRALAGWGTIALEGECLGARLSGRVTANGVAGAERRCLRLKAQAGHFEAGFG